MNGREGPRSGLLRGGCFRRLVYLGDRLIICLGRCHGPHGLKSSAGRGVIRDNTIASR